MIFEMLFGAMCVILFIIAIKWVQVFNNFQFLSQDAKEKFSNIEVYMKQRYDMIIAIIQMAKKYNIHENDTFTKVTEARSKWDTKAPLNERVTALAGLEDNYFKIQAVVENYPELKAVLIQNKVLDSDVQIENQLAMARLDYNRIVRDYNYRVKFFPMSIVAHYHHFEPYEFIAFGATNDYVPQKLYDD